MVSGQTDIVIRLQKKGNGGTYVVNAVDTVTLSRSVNTASELSFELLRDNTVKSGINVTPEYRDIVSLTIDGKTVFLGYIIELTKHARTIDVTAVDQLNYLAGAYDNYAYGDITASDLLNAMSQRFQFSLGNVTNSGYTIPGVILDLQTLLDTLVDAINITFEATGRRFYLNDKAGQVCFEGSSNLRLTSYEINQHTCQSYDYKEGTEDLYNSILVYVEDDESEGKRMVYEARDEESIRKYGLLQYPTTISKDENPKTVGDNLLKEKGVMTRTLDVSGALGNTEIYGGTIIHVNFYSMNTSDTREFVKGNFRVDSVTHTFRNATHTMDLNCTLDGDMEQDWIPPEPDEEELLNGGYATNRYYQRSYL